MTKVRIITKNREIYILIIIIIVSYLIQDLIGSQKYYLISVYVQSNDLLEYVLEFGHLPNFPIQYYQPIIFLFNMLTVFEKIIPATNLLFLSYPILVYFLSEEIMSNIVSKKQNCRIPLFTAILATFNYSFPLYNSTFVFFSITFLILLYLKDGLTTRFFIFAFSSSFISAFYYYSAQIIFTVFIFLFYLMLLVDSKKNLQKQKLRFLLLTNFNFFLTFIFYGVVESDGATAFIQEIIRSIFDISPQVIFISLTLVLFLITVIIFKIWNNIFQKIVQWIQNNIKIVFISLCILIILFLGLLILNISSLFDNKVQNLNDISFPPPYFNNFTRMLNFVLLMLIVVPFGLYFITLLNKFRLGLLLNSLDLFYIVSICLIIVFIPLFYLFGGLNVVFLRSTPILVVFSLYFCGFFYLDTKNYLTYLKNPWNLDKFGEKECNPERICQKQTKPKYISIILISIQIMLFGVKKLIEYYNFNVITNDLFKLIYSVIFYIIPGYFLIHLLNFKLDYKEKIIWSLFISYCILLIELSFLNLISQFNTQLIDILPIFSIFIIIIIYSVKLIVQNTIAQKKKVSFSAN
ncbi:hypothetical protein [Candidatus Lokiarchaeum ossiferum]|uniref:hypothetical protein n=1 Tax=Candidatus Lokiarchaeum ossiferum TaxID=2951803 RepID=UPI00352F50A5